MWVFQVLPCLITQGGVVIMLVVGSVQEHDRNGVG